MPEDFKIIIENKENYFKWLNKIKKGTSDARPLWTSMTPQIIEFVNFQFNEGSDTGKRWKRLTPRYKKWKVRHGFSPMIGIKAGRLKEAAGSKAIKRSTRTSLSWAVNHSVATSVRGKEYAGHFNRKRPIYRNVALRTNSFLKTDINNFPNRTGFTYNWLKKSLIPTV